MPSTPAPSAPTVIRAASSADFLSLLPVLTGYTVTNSLLVVLFSGNRSFGSLRFDLPASDAPRDVTSLAAAVREAVRSITQVDGVAFAVITDRSSSDCGGVPWRNLARRLEQHALRAGLVLRDSCCVAADGWCSFLSPEPGDRLRPLSEIRHSMAGLEASMLVEEAVPELEQLGELPSPAAGRAVEVRAAIEELLAHPARTARGSVFTAPRLSALIEHTEATPTALDTARVAVCAGNPAGWLRLVCALLESALADGYPTGEVGAEDSGPVSEAVYIADCLDRGGAFDDPGELMRAYGPLEHTLVRYGAVQPDRARHRRASQLLAEIAAATPAAHQPGLRCLLAWLWWWVGLSSIAERHLRAAREIDPEHQLTLMLGRLIDHGTLPPWTADLSPLVTADYPRPINA